MGVTNQTKKKAVQSRASRSGLNFGVGRVARLMKKGNYANRVGETASVYCAAVLEYLTSEIAELAGKAAVDNKKNRITPRHLTLAVKNDDELNRLLSNVCFKLLEVCCPASVTYWFGWCFALPTLRLYGRGVSVHAFKVTAKSEAPAPMEVIVKGRRSLFGALRLRTKADVLSGATCGGGVWTVGTRPRPTYDSLTPPRPEPPRTANIRELIDL